ncbi:MAG: hypothetical protein ABSF43_10230 [Rectinemataceae bacterium]
MTDQKPVPTIENIFETNRSLGVKKIFQVPKNCFGLGLDHGLTNIEGTAVEVRKGDGLTKIERTDDTLRERGPDCKGVMIALRLNGALMPSVFPDDRPERR